jgi:hypothetical protein
MAYIAAGFVELEYCDTKMRVLVRASTIDGVIERDGGVRIHYTNGLNFDYSTPYEVVRKAIAHAESGNTKEENE